MAIEIKVPVLPESVADATVLTWHKKAGDAVKRDEVLVELETDKVILEVPAAEDGVLQDILKPEGETVVAEELLGNLVGGGAAGSVPAEPSAPSGSVTAAPETTPQSAASAEVKAGPAARKMAAEKNVDLNTVKASGKSVTKEDVAAVVGHVPKAVPAPTSAPAPAPAPKAPAAVPAQKTNSNSEREKRVPMSRMRKRIAERLLEAQQTNAILTTFNEVDLSEVMRLRKKHQDTFVKLHDVKVGFMSFFVKAAVEALRRFPEVNASIDGNDIVYHGFFDIGVAVSSNRGLVVPVVRNADQLSLAGIEKEIIAYAKKAQAGALTIEEMTGGTFTVSNGGVFGSMLSTPILNPPQSAILGMHTIQQRAMVVDGHIVARPMMYLALSYDHRIIDGKDAVGFLKTIKELLEEPTRILLDI